MQPTAVKLLAPAHEVHQPDPDVCPICGFSVRTSTTVRILIPSTWTEGRSNIALLCASCETCILTDEWGGSGLLQLETESQHECTTCSANRLTKFTVLLDRYRMNPRCGRLTLKCLTCGAERPMNFADVEEERESSQSCSPLGYDTASYVNSTAPATASAGYNGNQNSHAVSGMENVSTKASLWTWYSDMRSAVVSNSQTSQFGYAGGPAVYPHPPTNSRAAPANTLHSAPISDKIQAMWLKSLEDAGHSPTSCAHCADASRQQPFFNVDGFVTHVLCTSCGARTNWSVGDGRTTPKTLVTDVAMLKPGDHVAWHRPCGIWHHAIVFDTLVLPDFKQVEVVHYNGSVNKLTEGFVSVRREWVDVDVADGNLYRIDYDPTTCFPPQIVMARACERLKETEYNPFKKNCEHFARWCKTGHERSVQIERIPIRIGKAADRLAEKIGKQPWFKTASSKIPDHRNLVANITNKFKSLW